MDDLEEKERDINDLMFPKKKTLTDLWREKWEREFNVHKRESTGKKSKLV